MAQDAAPTSDTAAVKRRENDSDCTAYRIRKVARRVSQIYDEALAPYGLTIGQFSILAQARFAGGARLGEMAELLGMDGSTLSRLVQPLIGAGFITFEADETDRRVKRILLTPEGRAILKRAVEGWNQAQAQITTALGEDRRAALHDILDDSIKRL